MMELFAGRDVDRGQAIAHRIGAAGLAAAAARRDVIVDHEHRGRTREHERTIGTARRVLEILPRHVMLQPHQAERDGDRSRDHDIRPIALVRFLAAVAIARGIRHRGHPISFAK